MTCLAVDRSKMIPSKRETTLAAVGNFVLWCWLVDLKSSENRSLSVGTFCLGFGVCFPVVCWCARDCVFSELGGGGIKGKQQTS